MGEGTEQVLDEADRNLVAIWRALVGFGPEPDTTERDGLLLLTSGVPSALFNRAFVSGAGGVVDPKAAVATMVEHFGRRGSPFVLVFRDDIAPGLSDACAAAGLVEHWQMPLMVLDPIPEHGEGAAPPPGFEVVVVDDHNVSAYADVMASGFGMPRDALGDFLGPETVRLEGFTGFLGLLDGEPVATSALFLTEDTAGVYNVATLEPARKRGIGAAITWAAALAGLQAGAKRSVLQASELGEPVYERMGYLTPVRYRQFVAPPS